MAESIIGKDEANLTFCLTSRAGLQFLHIGLARKKFSFGHIYNKYIFDQACLVSWWLDIGLLELIIRLL